MTARRQIVRFLLVACLAGQAGGCGASTQPVRARVVDASGRPVAGAVFYAESQRHEEVIDFVWCTTGADGEARGASGQPLVLGWRDGARLALAAFAPDKQPLVLYDAGGRLRADGIDLPLEDLRPAGQRWEPRLAQLAFPFETNATLAKRAAAPECAALRDAFTRAYVALDDAGQPVLPREQNRREGLRRLEAAASRLTQSP